MRHECSAVGYELPRTVLGKTNNHPQNAVNYVFCMKLTPCASMADDEALALACAPGQANHASSLPLVDLPIIFSDDDQDKEYDEEGEAVPATASGGDDGDAEAEGSDNSDNESDEFVEVHDEQV